MQSAKTHIILIDGKSGAGKTRLALTMSARLGGVAIHLDDVYPGWGGLIAGRDEVIDNVLLPLSRGVAGEYVTWDWIRNRPGHSVSVPPAKIVVAEGCGISTPSARGLADTVIWVECPDSERVERLRERDGDSFAEEFAGWEEQVAAHIAENEPDSMATVVVRTSTGQTVGG